MRDSGFTRQRQAMKPRGCLAEPPGSKAEIRDPKETRNPNKSPNSGTLQISDFGRSSSALETLKDHPSGILDFGDSLAVSAEAMPVATGSQAPSESPPPDDKS